MSARKFLRGIIVFAVLFILVNYPLRLGKLEAEKPKEGIQTGTISGRIFQPDLKGCADAEVEIKLGKENKIKGKTDKKGRYHFGAVPAGTGYSVIAKKGKLSATAKSVKVTAGKNTTVNLILKTKKDS